MQALSFAVHIPLVCFGISFPVMVLFVEWLALRTGDPVYLTLARRWTRILVTLFAVGVITGTVLSFEMGLLWPNFTGTFGGVFGLGFAIEGFSFFMEAIFIGIYVYGWGRLSPRAHFLSGIPVVITGFLGSLMVIAVNAWMNHPGGFHLRGGRVVDVDPFKALFEDTYLWHELIHMYIAGYIVTGFILAGVYAFGRLRNARPPTRYERAALTIPLTIAALAAPVQVAVGDWAARDVATTQPIKLAAIEGLYKTTRGAPEHLLGWYTGHEVKFGIAIPHLLSILAFHSWNAKVPGLDTVPPDQRPPVNVVRVAFQSMVGIGTLLALLGVVYLAVWIRRRRLPESPWFYRALVLAAPLALVALISGWVVTEVGRQPWVVYRVMPTAAAVTGAQGIPIGYGVLAASYVVVAGGLIWVLRRLARAPLELDRDPHTVTEAA
ncbi:MAG: cytochrome bd ubiquinol oxidase subunit [Solirubrobacteraceae bacterium]|jgi:cytochrome d ubiquinol oxidase subunit I|nr:cytochrome bd ubiquinol oxidase subunit [Solirubrobacteraceae bacterium]